MSHTIFERIRSDEAYVRAKREMVGALGRGLAGLSAPKAPDADRANGYAASVKRVGELRGRELYYPWVGSGAGRGPLIELGDGSVKYDLITGIGVHFFGHGNLELFEAQLDGLWCDVMQGNLGPGPEYGELLSALLSNVGAKSRLKHGWLTTCGATANEIALKIIRQKKYPATKVMAFKHCFAGRTTALQEITDNPKYREGQPLYGDVSHIPFFDPASKKSPGEQASETISVMREELDRHPGKYACLEFEIVQGEGGFTVAPREFLLPVIQEARAQGLMIWDDEIQTFGRTGEVFCYQRLGLDEYIDVVTVAKLLQTGAVLYTAELNPKPGLVSGTFAGSSGGVRAGVWAIQKLRSELCGEAGKIRKLEAIAVEEFSRLSRSPIGRYIVDSTVFGGMVAFTLFDGSLEKTKAFLMNLWKDGAAAFFAGHGPYRVRMLPPFGAMSEEQWRQVFRMIENAVGNTAKDLGLC